MTFSRTDDLHDRVRPDYASVRVRRRARRLFEKGYGYKAVSQKLGLPLYTVRDWARSYRRGEFHDEIAPRLFRYQDEARVRVLDLRRDGLSYRQIAAQTGIPYSTCYVWVKEEEQNGTVRSVSPAQADAPHEKVETTESEVDAVAKE